MFSDLYTNLARHRPQLSPLASELRIQCCPIIIDDNADNGPGSFLNGQILFDFEGSSCEIHDLQLSLHLVTTYKKPAFDRCHECRVQSQPIHTWSPPIQPVRLSQGLNSIPFSELLPSYLPPTIQTSAVRLEYRIRATAIAADLKCDNPNLRSVSAEESVSVTRASSKPRLPTYCSRSFSKSGIQCCAILDSLDPHGTNNISIDVSGLVKESAQGSKYAWKITRAEWVLEQTVQTRPPACDSHIKVAPRSEVAADLGAQTCRLANKTIYDCWAYATPDEDAATLDFTVDLPNKNMWHSATICSYDVPEFDCVKVGHTLTVELSMMLSKMLPDSTTETTKLGAGMIVKAVFPVQVMEHTGGLEIGDGEQPPAYDGSSSSS